MDVIAATLRMALLLRSPGRTRGVVQSDTTVSSASRAPYGSTSPVAGERHPPVAGDTRVTEERPPATVSPCTSATSTPARPSSSASASPPSGSTSPATRACPRSSWPGARRRRPSPTPGRRPTRRRGRIDTVAGVRQFEISTPVARGAAGPVGQLPALGRRAGSAPTRRRGPRGRRRAGAPAPGERVRRRDRRRRARGRAARRLRGDLHPRHFAGRRRPARLHRARRRRAWRTAATGCAAWSRWHTAIARAGRRAGPVRAVRERPPGPARPGRERVRRRDGRAVRPVHRVAAAQPARGRPDGARRAAELATPSERNRPIADPYPRFLVARDQVNQGAAVLLMSVAAARRLGVPAGPVGLPARPRRPARARPARPRRPERLARPRCWPSGTRSRSPASASTTIATFDLYSCFPIAVSTVAATGWGWPPTTRAGLTLTGGLPFFGGAGNNYSMHAIAETVAALPRRPRARSASSAPTAAC